MQELLRQMGLSPSSYPQGLAHRAIYCSRTLNLRSIQVLCASTLSTSFSILCIDISCHQDMQVKLTL